jgi:hypothetical protein
MPSLFQNLNQLTLWVQDLVHKLLNAIRVGLRFNDLEHLFVYVRFAEKAFSGT